MIRGRTSAGGSTEFYDDADPSTVVASITKDGITGPGTLVGPVVAVNTAPDFPDLATATSAYNELLTALRARGVIGGA